MALPQSILGGLPPDYHDTAIQQLSALYQRAAERILARTNARLLRDQRKLTVRAKQSRELLIEVENILQELDNEAARWIAQNIPKTYRDGA